jgi:hypothetical protein
MSVNYVRARLLRVANFWTDIPATLLVELERSYFSVAYTIYQRRVATMIIVRIN